MTLRFGILTDLEENKKDKSTFFFKCVDTAGMDMTGIAVNPSQGQKQKLKKGNCVVARNFSLSNKMLRIIGPNDTKPGTKLFLGEAFDISGPMDALWNSPLKSIPEALGLPGSGIRMSVEGKVTEVSVLHSGPTWKRRDITLQDKDTMQKIVVKVWDPEVSQTDDLEVDMFLTIKNVTVNQYANKNYLMSTRQTSVEVVKQVVVAEEDVTLRIVGIDFEDQSVLAENDMCYTVTNIECLKNATLPTSVMGDLLNDSFTITDELFLADGGELQGQLEDQTRD